MTPLERLGAAIEAFLRETDAIDASGFVTGWVLAASTARVQSEDASMLPLVTGSRYALGPETSVTNAAGLTKFLEIVLERAQWQMLNQPDNE